MPVVFSLFFLISTVLSSPVLSAGSEPEIASSAALEEATQRYHRGMNRAVLFLAPPMIVEMFAMLGFLIAGDGPKFVGCVAALTANVIGLVAAVEIPIYRIYARSLRDRQNAIIAHLMKLFGDFKHVSNQSIPPRLVAQMQPEARLRIAARWAIVGLTHMPSFVRPYDPLTSLEEIIDNHSRELDNALPTLMNREAGAMWSIRYWELVSAYEETLREVSLDAKNRQLGFFRNTLIDRHELILSRLRDLGHSLRTLTFLR